MIHASVMVHSGLSPSAMSRHLASTNIPPISQRSSKLSAREIDPQLEKFAHSICADSVSKVLKLSGDNNGASSVDLTASFDMGWQCDGSVKIYNSKSGHVVLLIGKNSGKIMNYATRISNC